MNTDLVYGMHRCLGWGVITINTETWETLDFDPEYECRSDVKYFWKNRKNILKLKYMSLFKYVKILVKGIKRYRSLDKY